MKYTKCIDVGSEIVRQITAVEAQHVCYSQMKKF